MAANNSIVAEAVLEDKLADFWPDYPCLYDVQCPEFKNRELRDKAIRELAEKLGRTCKIILNFYSIKSSSSYFLQRNSTKHLAFSWVPVKS
jgi:hypothetical protein